MKKKGNTQTSKKAFTQKILVFQGTGFGLVICLLMFNELLDLPHSLLGAPSTPVNWQEGIVESVLVLCLALGTLCWTYYAVSRIRYLEGFLPVCGFCKKIRVGDQWILIEEFIADNSEAVCSHGLCPKCAKEHYPEYVEQFQSR